MHLDPIRWAWRCYRHHLPLVLAISAIPATERFVSQLTEVPPVTEVVTLAARVLLVAMVVRIGLLADPRIDTASIWQRTTASARTHWRVLTGQALLLGALFTVFDVIPEQVVTRIADVGPLYWATLLAAKNFTVIPFTMIWMVGIVHRMALHDAERASVDA